MSRKKSIPMTEEERKARHAEHSREYRKKYPDRILASNIKYRAKHPHISKPKTKCKPTPESRKRAAKKYYEKNKEIILAQNKKYRDSLGGKVYWSEYQKAHSKERYERKIKKISEMTPEENAERLDIQNEYHRVYYLRNKERISAYSKRWNKDHLENRRKYMQNWSNKDGNKERNAEQAKNYYKERRRASKLTKAAQVEAIA